ncbi:hypothetical protein O181_031779 [Austropuccinia psidii MF-1]|uniref:Integrase catalytic domain-containing protein n=1 Tax=Austropuccinia psidii MF-1 TaxID=1389203 RepID=A0A9Q3CWC4_9BASI|nr:hypothetical protein [Austropuccinia psidii MF-1]
MFTNKEEFEEFEESNGNVQIGQEGVKIPIKGRGRKVKYFFGKKLIFEKALYVPQLPYNIISLTQLWNKGGDLKKIGNNSFSILKNKKRIFGGKIDNGLLHIQFDNQKAMISKHERLSHSGTEKGCEDCHLGKATRSQFKNKIKRNTDPIEEISINLMGPIAPSSLGGSKYVLVAVDTGCCFSWVCMLKEKSEAKEELLRIIRKLENIFEKNVKRIICDGGKEFVNKILKEFCDNRGINLIITTPYTPQHNDIVERTN